MTTMKKMAMTVNFNSSERGSKMNLVSPPTISSNNEWRRRRKFMDVCKPALVRVKPSLSKQVFTRTFVFSVSLF